MITREKNHQSDLEEIDLKSFLQGLGFNLSDDGKYWRSSAIYRDGSNPTALRISKTSGSFVDFVESKKGSLKDLIKLTTGKSIESLDKYFYENKISVELKEEKPTVTQEKTYDKSILKKLFKNYHFYNNRGISSETLKKFQSGLAMEGKMHLRYVFPIFNESGKIIGFDGRDVTGKHEDDLKWKKIGRKSNWLYPVYVEDENGERFCLKAIKEKKEVIIVESIGDMLALNEYGIENVIVTFGTAFSEKISSFLMSNSDINVVIATNNDFIKGEEKNVGKKFAYKIFIKLCSHINCERISIHLPQKKDFGEMNDTEIETWVKNKNSIDKLKTLRNVIDFARAEISNDVKINKSVIEKIEIAIMQNEN